MEKSRLLRQKHKLELERIAQLLRWEVDVKDRWSKCKLHRQCFVGRDAVTYLIKNEHASNRVEAVLLGRRLMRMGVFLCINPRLDFEDKNLFYEFVDEDDEGCFREVLSKRSLEAKLDERDAVKAAAKLSQGLVLVDRWFKLRYHRRTFFGDDAIEWLIGSRTAADKQQAMKIMQHLLVGGCILSVSGPKKLTKFENSRKLYKFSRNWLQADRVETQAVLDRARISLRGETVRHGNRFFRDAFTGERLVRYLTEEGVVESEDHAEEIAQLWLEKSIIHRPDNGCQDFSASDNVVYAFVPLMNNSTRSIESLKLSASGKLCSSQVQLKQASSIQRAFSPASSFNLPLSPSSKSINFSTLDRGNSAYDSVNGPSSLPTICVSPETYLL
eukprot:CAMPEP_0198729902 /NCGR_PEP_ID=MMETSP1475-20131203/21620_1 /TAXON_ID= ORGANISM="Unidentified sp., Strain CCMP1999" /NCGR_SAMPLE_ID=MMETSP1475 /ASSEMBLY_ACC=CAM_ASM_001111 /LENGTH=385 /DNA_ID=CAMNT_0044492625 /DNA_START=85 /DNA_END=1242 /DNA_ORIENTATION=+